MPKPIFLQWIKESYEQMTLRQRILYLSAGTTILLGLTVILFINIAAPFLVTQELGVPDTYVQLPVVDSGGNPGTVIMSTPAPDGFTIQNNELTGGWDALTAVKVLSVIGLILLSFFALLASRWIAQKSFEPVIRISKTARNIDVHNLDQRLNYSGAEDELKDFANSFDLMLQRLEYNFEEQSQFISNLAHELRTPLTSLRMNLEVLNSDQNASLVEYREFSATAERGITRLERLVEELLMLAKAEREIEREPIIVGVLLEDILEEVKPIAAIHKVSLRLKGDMETELEGDPILLHRAITNLVENSIYYNQEGGYVELSCRSVQGKAEIQVIDDGVGISKQQQAHIFERFYRSSFASSGNEKGNGLGLAITAHIIDLHGGCINVESDSGRGSIFTILL